LPDVQAALEYKLMVDVSPPELEALLVRGWRRFGPAYFRPACSACEACESIRLDIDRFVPTASQLRALRRARRFRVEVGPPQLDDARLALHDSWHHTRENMRGWEPSKLSDDEYATQFAFPSATGREAAWYDGTKLVALGLLDVTPNCLSAAYFFYAPSIARLSPGVGNVMLSIELARTLGCRHVYLGYRVEKCASLTYKGNFKPHELLTARVGPGESPVWREAAGAARD
jgi:arginine-tRNA-protein transferase